MIMLFMKSGSLFVDPAWLVSPRCTGMTWNPSFSLQWKSDESTKHYLIQILFAVNWHYWQWEKIQSWEWWFKVTSCKRASLKSSRFSQKQNKVGYFSNRVVCKPAGIAKWVAKNHLAKTSRFTTQKMQISSGLRCPSRSTTDATSKDNYQKDWGKKKKRKKTLTCVLDF